MRLFYALNFSDEVKCRLGKIKEELQRRSASGNFTQNQNFHLTLAFLGECNEKQTYLAKSVLDLLEVFPIELSFTKMGYFKRRVGDIWWVGTEENEKLLKLQHLLVKKLENSGFKTDNRFSPHITVGREVITEYGPWKIESFIETVCSVELMKSERKDNSLENTPIHSKASI